MNKRVLYALGKATRAAKNGQRAKVLHLVGTALHAMGYEKPRPKAASKEA